MGNSVVRRWRQDEDLSLKEMVLFMTHKQIGESLRRTTKAVRNRCWRLGLVDTSDNWTAEQIAKLKAAYSGAKYGSEINLDALAADLGRHKSLVCRKARYFGLTDKKRDMLPPEIRKIRKPKFSTLAEAYASTGAHARKRIAEKGHPRGSLGMNHTREVKEIISRKSSERWASMSVDQRGDHIVKAMRGRADKGVMQTMNRANASWGAAWREIGGVRKYFRSKWEANYARYLEWLKENKQIESWLHEPETFWFDGIKRGCMSYLPDFRVVEIGGSVVFHEVKGWMDDRSKTKIRRMAKYHPEVKLLVIDAKAYKAIKKVMQPIIKGWEVDSKGR